MSITQSKITSHTKKHKNVPISKSQSVETNRMKEIVEWAGKSIITAIVYMLDTHKDLKKDIA